MPKSLIEQLEERTNAITVKELAVMVNVSQNSVYDIIKAGQLSVLRIGSAVRIDPKTAADWVRKITA